MTFQIIITCSLLLLILSAVIVIAFRRAAPKNSVDTERRNELNRELYDVRLQEIEADVKQGKVVEQSSMVKELQYNLLDDITDTQIKPVNTNALIWLPGIILLVLGSIVFYASIGAFSKVDDWQTALVHYPDVQKKLFEKTDAQPTEEELKDLMIGLRTHLNTDPDDAKGWVLYSRLGRIFKDKAIAIDSIEKALAVRPDDSDIKLEYIELMLKIGDEFEQAKAKKVLQGLLKEQPNNYQAWSMFGFVALQKEDYAIAIKSWQKMLTLVNAGSEQAQMLSNSINYAQKQLLLQGQQSMQNEPAVQGFAYQVKVSLAAQASFNNNSTLFVYAQSVNGPPMPIAAVKLNVTKFPVTVTLSDADAMMEGVKLSDHKQFIMKARISNDGSVNKSSGQWFGVSEVVKSEHAEQINILIDQQS